MILLCEKKINPVGICISPSFSWRITNEEGTVQKAYTLKVFDANNEIYWDSGMVMSDMTAYIDYQGKRLKSHTRYFWQVTVVTDKNTYTSNTASFVTGVADDEWNAKWIATKTKNAPVFSKEFDFTKTEKEAFASVCGLGYFELTINSKKVGEDFYVPNRTDYDTVTYNDLQYPFRGETRKSLNYLTYNVTDYLKEGKNTVEIMLGNGMYKDTGRVTEGIFEYDELKMIFKLSCGDFELFSDESWQAYESPLVKNSMFCGEIYDARIKKGSYAAVHTAKKPEAKFSPQLAPADKVTEIIKPVKISDKVYDCKKNMTGIVKIVCSGNAGETVRIRFAENIDEDGKLNFKSTVGYIECDINQIQEDVYILSGDGVETYLPTFVWHAFRYFEVEAENVRIIDTDALYIHTAVESASSFECSSELLNNIHAIHLNAQKSNIHGAIPMDCPHRERLGYTGDGQNTSYSIMYNFDAYNVYKKWIKDIIDAQNSESGYVPHTVPFNGGGGGAGWGSAVVFIPWNVYLHYGDKKVLENALPAMKKWIGYLLERRNDKGLVYKEEEGSWCLGDWILPIDGTWDQPQTLYIPNELVNTCFLIRCIDTYNQTKKVLGTDEPEFCSERQNAADAVNSEYLKEYYAYGIQGCDVFPLYAGIAPSDNFDKLLSKIIKDLEKNNYNVDTGMFGTRYLFELLSDNNRDDVIYKILTKTNYPSYGYMVESGATSTWETWEGSGAQNHIGLTMSDFWFYSGLAGIKPTNDGGFKRFVIKPYFESELDFVKAEYMTVFGEIKVEWKRCAGKISLHIEIPFNTDAEVILNEEKKSLKCGKYDFTIN